MSWGHGWWMGGMMLVWLLPLLAAVLVGAVWFARANSQSTRSGPEAQEILDRRLAEGSISVEEYRQRKTTLTGDQVEFTNPGIDTSP